MSSTDEKKHRHSFFSKKRSPDSIQDSEAPTEKKNTEHDAVETTTPAAKAEEVPPVSFPQLFR